MIEKVKKITDSKLFKAIIINLIVFLTLFLLFEPTTKSDDYDMTCLLYGAVDGKYTPFILYSNVIWGYILCGLMNIMPSVSWYYVLQYILIYISLVSVTYILIKKGEIPSWLYISFLSLVVYEFCIRITFTKTSGLLIASGYFVILYLIEENKKISLGYLFGVILIILGDLIRVSMFMLLSEVFAAAFVIFLYKSYVNNSKCIRQCIYFVVIVGLCYFVSLMTNRYSAKTYNTDIVWSDYLTTNAIRAALVDYGVPDYSTYEEEYEKLGVSYEDYKMWFVTNNRADDRLDSELLLSIRSIANSTSHRTLIQKIDDANHNLLKYLFSNTMFYMFLICCLLLGLSDFPFKKISIFSVLLTCLFAYYYMYIVGRTQHHVDVTVFYAGTIMLMYYAANTNFYKKYTMIIALSFAEFMYIFYGDLITSSYYGRQFGNVSSQRIQYETQYNQLSYLRDDEKHLYLFNTSDTNTIYPCFTPFQVIDNKFYHNMYRLNMNHIPVFKNVLSDFGVVNPLEEMTNSNTIYYYVSNARVYEMDTVLNYVKKNYSANVEMLDVKWLDNSRVYRFYDENFRVDDSDLIEDVRDIKYEYETTVKKNRVRITGYIYEDNTDSFAQNVYIKLVDKKTGEASYYMTKQRINEELDTEDKYNGMYSLFKITINVPKRTWRNSDAYILLENENGLHSIPLDSEYTGE